MTKVKEKNLTEKEQKAVDDYLANGDRKKAIENAYNTDNPEVMAAQVFARPRVKAAVQDALTRLNITPSKILSRFEKQASKGKNEAAKVRANENLAQLADLYPDKASAQDNDTGGITINLTY